MSRRCSLVAGAAFLFAALPASAADSHAGAVTTPLLFGVPVDFVLFGLTLLGVALFHHHTLRVALIGLATITLYKVLITAFDEGAGLVGLVRHLGHEWVVLSNLFGLLVGFALLADHFEHSGVPGFLPRFLPDDWRGGFVLLVMVAVLSSFLDNIAAALIGGTMALSVFRGNVHIAYLAAIVACSNAGGAGSVVGDTTTTMMWIAGISPLAVLHAFVASAVAVVVCALPAARVQQRHSPIVKDVSAAGARIDWTRVGIVAAILVAAIATNVLVNVRFPEVADRFPFLGAAVWVVLLATAGLRRPAWNLLPQSARGSAFLLALVTCASMMPVEELPPASWQTAFGLGFVSAVFDNIPLTALAINQGGYDWGVLAYAVGFGGSMIWFGSSAGVAISNMFPEAKSAGRWLRHGWFVALAYVLGFFFLLGVVGWHPTPQRRDRERPAAAQATGHVAPVPAVPAAPREEP